MNSYDKSQLNDHEKRLRDIYDAIGVYPEGSTGKTYKQPNQGDPDILERLEKIEKYLGIEFKVEVIRDYVAKNKNNE